MTENEKDAIVTLLNAILGEDLVAVASKVYPGEENLPLLQIGDFTLSEVIVLIARASKQLLTELKSENWKFLPSHIPDTQRSFTLHSQIAAIQSTLANRGRFTDLTAALALLIRYEMGHGFWDRSKTRQHNVNELNVTKALTANELLTQSLATNMTAAEQTRAQLQDSIQELNEFIEQKEHQFTTLDNTLESASKSLAAVRDSENEAATSNGKIATLLDQVDKTLDASRKRIEKDRKLFTDTHTSVTAVLNGAVEQLSTLKEHREEFDALVESAREKEQHILDKEKRINELLGFAADGALGTEFSKRRDALQKSIVIWGFVSALAVAGALYWVVYVFQGNPSQDKNGVNWLVMLANVVRTSPAFIFVYFCLSQFTKERNLQEEYAFKAAMAMTITAYSDMINTSDERIKMLISTIQGIYTPPTIGKPFSPLSFDTKHLADASKNVADTVKTLQSTITDVIKPTKPEA